MVSSGKEADEPGAAPRGLRAGQNLPPAYRRGAGNPAFTSWRKSSWSTYTNGCVEVACRGGLVGVRDTKDNGEGPVISVAQGEWETFLRRVKEDRLCLDA